MRSITTILIVLFLSFNAVGQKKMIHPGMLNSKEELDFIKKKIKAGEEPWNSSFKLLQNDEHAKPDWQPKPIAEVIRGSYNNPNIGAGDLGHDAQAAYIQSLEWTLTGNKQYAKKAIEILNAWSYKLKSISIKHLHGGIIPLERYNYMFVVFIFLGTSDDWHTKKH